MLLSSDYSRIPSSTEEDVKKNLKGINDALGLGKVVFNAQSKYIKHIKEIYLQLHKEPNQEFLKQLDDAMRTFNQVENHIEYKIQK